MGSACCCCWGSRVEEDGEDRIEEGMSTHQEVRIVTKQEHSTVLMTRSTTLPFNFARPDTQQSYDWIDLAPRSNKHFDSPFKSDPPTSSSSPSDQRLMETQYPKHIPPFLSFTEYDPFESRRSIFHTYPKHPTPQGKKEILHPHPKPPIPGNTRHKPL